MGLDHLDEAVLEVEARAFLRVAFEDDLATLSDYEMQFAVRHFMTLLRSMKIFLERSRRYKDGWRSRGWKGNVCDILRKAERVRSMFWEDNYRFTHGITEADVDDLLDLPNYCAFAIHNIEDDRRWS
jgi:hypothetical protein